MLYGIIITLISEKYNLYFNSIKQNFIRFQSDVSQFSVKKACELYKFMSVSDFTQSLQILYQI